MIVKNEEENLGRCLTQVAGLVDELIVVDTGSTDKTKEIATRFTDKIYDFEWIDDFSAARNFSFSKATKPYILWLDADDIITPKNLAGLEALKKTLRRRYAGVYMPYQHLENGAVINSFYRLRLVRADLSFYWRDRIHETLVSDKAADADYLYSDVAIRQNIKPRGTTTRYLEMLGNIVAEGDADLRTLHLYGSELDKHGRAAEATAQFEAYFAQGGIDAADCLFACMQLGTLYENAGEAEKALDLYGNCMERCGGRAEYCCQLGHFYANVAEDWNEAVFWYRAALDCVRPPYATVLERFYYYVPHFWLWQIYQAGGMKELAEQHMICAVNEMKRLEDPA
jgi:glycosyltransferase involved in cell wall biosynthesis